MIPRAVFVADDLGASPGVNDGVARALEAGLVREVSLAATGAALEEGARVAASAGAGVGLHLALTMGEAVSGPIAGLTDRAGRFLPLPRVLLACLARRPSVAAVTREIEGQLDRLERLGLTPGHLDGHHHVHAFPVVRDAVVAVARRRGIPWIRVPRERSRGGRASPRIQLLRALSVGLSRRARRAGLRALPFAGLGLHDRADYADRLERLLSAPPAAAFELMVHPRIEDAAFRALDRLGARGERWRAELSALTDPALVARFRSLVSPVRFADL